jgi:lantibiotic biosynthesis protein
MKQVKSVYSPFGKYVLRSPLFPYSFISKFVASDNVPEEYFSKVLRNDIVREAIFLASPSLLTELDTLHNSQGMDPAYVKDLKISLSKYLIRMASRCTPFGLFAGFSLGEFGDKTEIVLDNIHKYRTHTRFDMNYLVALSLDLIKNAAIRNNIKYYPNSSINKIGNKIRYVEYKYIKSERVHNIVSVDNSEYLNKILEKADHGADIKALSEIITDSEISYDVAESFVNELIESQLLVSDIEPSVTGEEYVHRLVTVLEKIDDISGITEILKKAQDQIEEIDQSEPGASSSKFIQISELIKPLGTEFKMNYLFQTDLQKPIISAMLDKKIAQDVLIGVDVLSKLTFEPQESKLSKFIEKFEKRYGDREICILEALDPELGIGFLTSGTGGEDNPPLLEKLPVRIYAQNSDKIYWNKNVELLDKKIIESIRNNSDHIVITDSDIKDFESKTDKMAPTFSVVARITGKNEKGEDLIYISSAGGSNSAYLLGRFCHADKETDVFTRSMSEKEEEILKDHIVSEIVHLPQDRVGNVLLHPRFHDYEIPYLARPNADTEHQIKLDDIYLSVSGKKLVLRSRKLGRIILPRLSNAHNYTFNAQPIYQFLCEMQFQGILRGAGLPLGNALDRYNFVPRIIYNNIILHFAEWKVKKKELEPFTKIKDNKELTERFENWRKSRKIPALVSLEEGDNTLLLNLTNLFCIEILLTSIKSESIKLCEFLFDENSAVVKSDEGSFTNEFIISYYRNEQ